MKSRTRPPLLLFLFLALCPCLWLANPPQARAAGKPDRTPVALLVVGELKDPKARAHEEALVRRFQDIRKKSGLTPADLPILTYHMDVDAERKYCEGRLGVRRNELLFAGLALLAADRLPSQVIEGQARVQDVKKAAEELGVMALARTGTSAGELGQAPDLPVAYADESARGDVAFRQQDYASAFQHYLKAARARPEEWRGVYRQALTLAAMRRYSEAETVALAATALAPDNPLPHTILAVAIAAQSRFEEAQTEFRKAIALAPGWAMPHDSLAEFAMSRKIWDVARAEALEASRLDPRLASPHFVLGTMGIREWKLDEACAQFEEALRLRPDWGLACEMLGWARIMRGDFPAAARAFDQQGRLEPTSAAPLIGHAMILYYQQKPAPALALFARARRVEPRNPMTPALEAFALAALGKGTEAMGAAREALARSPRDANAREGLGHALSTLGQFPQACAAYAEAERLLDGWPEPELLYRWALASDRQGDRPEAIALARRLLRQYPRSIYDQRARDLLGKWHAAP